MRAALFYSRRTQKSVKFCGQNVVWTASSALPRRIFLAYFLAILKYADYTLPLNEEKQDA